MTPRRMLITALTLVALGCGLTAGGWGEPADADDHGRTAHPVRLGPISGTILVGSRPAGAPIAPGFAGFSVEYPSLATYAGSPSDPLNSLFVRLVRSVDPHPVLRVGGDSTDATWWPVRGWRQPPSVSFTLTPGWLQRLRVLVAALHARVVLGVNLKANSLVLAATEARVLRAAAGKALAALELGNEPSNYAQFAAYRIHGKPFFARSRRYRFRSFLREFDAVRRAVPRAPLAGPALGASSWMRDLRWFVKKERSVSLVTVHRYPLSCFALPGSPRFASTADLLASAADDVLPAGLRRDIAAARAGHRPFRVDELNSVSCGGRAGVSNSFAAALWLLDSLFELGHAGVSGVNIHTFPGAAYAPFAFRRVGGRYSVHVSPPFLGLLMFARAAPAGVRLLPSVSSVPGLQTWATRAPSGATRILLINPLVGTAPNVALTVNGEQGPARVERLTAPSLSATDGARLAGQSYAHWSDTAQLAGRPVRLTLAPVGGRYVVNVPAASATLLQFGR